MRIYIGPYVYRWVSNVHNRHMDLKYGRNSWEDNKDWEDRAWERVENGLQWCYNKTINRFLDEKKRKVKIRIDRYDTWSMDHTLAIIILPMLKQLKETNHGSPQVSDWDVPNNLRSTSAPPKENEYDTDENHHKRWEWVLDEMIWAFEQKTRDWWEEDYIIEHPEIDFENKEKVEHEGETFYELKWRKKGVYDDEGRKAHQERMTNGFRLFGKYYEALWD